VIGTVIVLLLAVVGYRIWGSFFHPAPAAPPPGCQAGSGNQALSLDTDQAAIAATIAGVAARDGLPMQAVTIAYAAALQESKLHNVDYGDRDSIGIFQQRPSQGWGPAADLEDPIYATTKFFAVLTQVPGYTRMPVDQAAQAVQHSADGSAYQQWADVAGQMAAYFTGRSPHGVSCWFTPAGRADLAGAVRRMTETFGPEGREGVVTAVNMARSGPKNSGTVAVVHVQPAAAWTVASWLVAHAQDYGLSEVRYAGYEWKAADGSMGWQRNAGPAGPSTKNDPPSGSIVAG
jgi:hypothetical protein